MISCATTGNFGDHIVRYALTRSVAEENGYQWAINKVPSHDYFGGREQLDFFHLDYGLPNNTPYGFLPDGIKHEWIEIAKKYKDYDFYEYQPEVFYISDNTNLKIFCAQDARYYDRRKLRKWFTIGKEETETCEKILKDNNIILDKNLTIINCRGGEYKGVPNLFLKPEYYQNAINYILSIIPKMKFIVITDDVEYYKNIFNYPVYHFSICCDYYIINNAKNLILSNSGFALFPAWLNENTELVVAPLHWARHNMGYWANSSIWTFGKEGAWVFLDKNGKIFTYKESIRA
jgi:hypothetical protein